MSIHFQNSQQITDILLADTNLNDDLVILDINDFIINIRSNSTELLDWCRYYFSHVLHNKQDSAIRSDIEIIAVERQPLELDIDFQDWIRTDKAKARKDAIYDIPGARLLKKVRTGMIFLQSRTDLIAAGECLKNKNQIINFINTQYMTHIENHQAVICHAAGLVTTVDGHDQALGMAGFSGGGKSTLMLHMLAKEGSRFLSNDRLFLQRSEALTRAIGIPKLPRINPGTILHNPKLQNLISSQRRDELLQLPEQQLWELEEKYDVFIDESYGPNKIQYQAEIKHFIVLNWRHDSNDSVKLEKINLAQRDDLLAAIMKSPGPFYQYENGDLYQYQTPLNQQSYLDVFQDINVYEASGKVDFKALSQLCYQLFPS